MDAIQIFHDKQANEQFHELGFVKHGSIEAHALHELVALNDHLQIPDTIGCGYNCGMNTDKALKRRSMHDGIRELLQSSLEQVLVDFEQFTASFINKMPLEDCFVNAHQDFSFTDESVYPSFMCFIPLTDVNIENAALGLIPYSHRFFDYVRAFPFPLAKNPVTENDKELMKYFHVINMKAGEMLFFNQKTIHGSFSNYSKSIRNAVSVALLKRAESPLLYLHNPETSGQTILKYKVDTYSIVEYNNPVLSAMYHEEGIDLPYELVEEMPVQVHDTSWENLEQKLVDAGLQTFQQNIELLDRYYRYQEKRRERKSLFKRILQRAIRK